MKLNEKEKNLKKILKLCHTHTNAMLIISKFKFKFKLLCTTIEPRIKPRRIFDEIE